MRYFYLILFYIGSFFSYLGKKAKSLVKFQREFICVTDGGISAKKIGIGFIIWNILLIIWSGFATINYFQLNNLLLNKDIKILSLKENQQKLLSNIILLDSSLQKLTYFVNNVNKYDRIKSVAKTDAFDFDKDNTGVAIILDRIRHTLHTANDSVVERIKFLKNRKDTLSFNDNIELVSHKDNDEELYQTIDSDVADSVILKRTLDENVSKLTELENFINNLPLVSPINYIRVSSPFGGREDPISGEKKFHHGIDLVGPYFSKIYAPAPANVTFVGVKSGYGKIIILQHENDIKTIYAHLNSTNVKVGDKVERGDVIGIQGSTGRTTGDHLHYEIVKGKNFIYDPSKVLEVGSELF